MNSHVEKLQESKFQWQPIIELAILMFTTLGTTIPLYLHTDSKIEKRDEKWMEMKKESDQRFREMDQKFYDLLKEKKQ